MGDSLSYLILSCYRLPQTHTDDNSQTISRHFFQPFYNHDIFSAVLFQSKFNISNYEMMNEVYIVFFPCLYIKARKSTCNFH